MLGVIFGDLLGWAAGCVPGLAASVDTDSVVAVETVVAAEDVGLMTGAVRLVVGLSTGVE